MTKMSPWKRLLWLKQEYPDNYTDPSFIELRIRQENESSKKSNRKLSEAACSQIRLDFISFYQTVLTHPSFTLLLLIFITTGYNPIMPTIFLSFLTWLSQGGKLTLYYPHSWTLNLH